MNIKKDKVKSLMQLVDEKYNETYGADKWEYYLEHKTQEVMTRILL
jgi:hypothetical protein